MLDARAPEGPGRRLGAGGPGEKVYEGWGGRDIGRAGRKYCREGLEGATTQVLHHKCCAAYARLWIMLRNTSHAEIVRGAR